MWREGRGDVGNGMKHSGRRCDIFNFPNFLNRLGFRYELAELNDASGRDSRSLASTVRILVRGIRYEESHRFCLPTIRRHQREAIHESLYSIFGRFVMKNDETRAFGACANPSLDS